MSTRFKNYDGPVVEVDILTREVVARYPGSEEAIAGSTLNSTTVRKMLKDRTFPLCGTTYYRFEDDFDPEQQVAKGACAPVYMLRGNRLRTFDSTKDVARALGISPDTARVRVSRGSWKGIRFGRIDRGLPRLLRELEAEIG